MPRVRGPLVGGLTSEAIEWAALRRPVRQPRAGRIPLVIAMSKRLYVGNLSFQTTESTLTSAFEQDGRKVAKVDMVMDRDTGRPRGFAFVEMASDADADAAIQAMDGTSMDGRSLRVNVAEERKPRSGDRGRRERRSEGW